MKKDVNYQAIEEKKSYKKKQNENLKFRIKKQIAKKKS